MRLARLAVAGLVSGILAGFAVALLRPRRGPAGEPELDDMLSRDERPVGWGNRLGQPAASALAAQAAMARPPLMPVVPEAGPQDPVV